MLPQIVSTLDCGFVVSAPRVEVVYYKVTSVRLLQFSRHGNLNIWTSGGCSAV